MADSRYPNMSYCMMNNTDLALAQVLEHMVEALGKGPEGVRKFLTNMDRDELRSFFNLLVGCEQFVELAKEMEFSRTAVDAE